MRLTLTATGLESKVRLYRISVDENGHWTYESRAVEFVKGHLPPGEIAQLQGLYLAVDWGKHVLNFPISADDRIHFRLDVGDGAESRTYQFSEAINHASYQFKDLVHFLRHNLATGGDPIGPLGWEEPEPPSLRP